MQEEAEYNIEFIESGEDAANTFESPKQPLDLSAPSVHQAIICPRSNPVVLGRHDRRHDRVQGQLSCLIALIGTIPNHVACLGSRALKQRPADRRIVGLTGRQRETHRRAGIRGNQMNFGGPAPSGFADGLRAVFFNAPVPSG